MDNRDQIIEKVRKILALAERAGTEGEAFAAMNKVQEMFTRHNLELDDIKGSDEESFTHDFKEYEWNASWIRTTCAGIAKLYFCHMYYEPHGQECQRIFFVGKKVNIITAQYVCDLVISTGKRLAKSYAQECYKEFGLNPVSASNNFKKGYATRINVRCQELIREAQEGHLKNVQTGKAIVVADLYRREIDAIKTYERDTLGLLLVGGAGMAGGDHSHMSAGASAANNISLRANAISGAAQTHYLTGSK